MELPDCVAVIEQVPKVMIVTVLPDTVQTAGVLEVKPTTRFELAVALSEIGEAGKVTAGNGLKEIVCVAGTTEKVCVTGVAAG